MKAFLEVSILEIHTLRRFHVMDTFTSNLVMWPWFMIMEPNWCDYGLLVRYSFHQFSLMNISLWFCEKQYQYVFTPLFQAHFLLLDSYIKHIYDLCWTNLLNNIVWCTLTCVFVTRKLRLSTLWCMFHCANGSFI